MADGSFSSRKFSVIKARVCGEVRLKCMIDDYKFIDPGAEGLMLLEPTNVLAGRVMNDAHDVMQSGVKHTLARSRSWCWIVHGKKLAEAVLKGCSVCKLERAKCMTPVLSNLSGDKTKLSEPFECCQ